MSSNDLLLILFVFVSFHHLLSRTFAWSFLFFSLSISLAFVHPVCVLACVVFVLVSSFFFFSSVFFFQSCSSVFSFRLTLGNTISNNLSRSYQSFWFGFVPSFFHHNNLYNVCLLKGELHLMLFLEQSHP